MMLKICEGNEPLLFVVTTTFRKFMVKNLTDFPGDLRDEFFTIA